MFGGVFNSSPELPIPLSNTQVQDIMNQKNNLKYALHQACAASKKFEDYALNSLQHKNVFTRFRNNSIKAKNHLELQLRNYDAILVNTFHEEKMMILTHLSSL